jgi:hypothetical protein
MDVLFQLLFFLLYFTLWDATTFSYSGIIHLSFLRHHKQKWNQDM